MDGKALIKTHEYESGFFYPDPHKDEIIALIDAALAQARAEEREACAAYLEEIAKLDVRTLDGMSWPKWNEIVRGALEQAACAIRARTQP